MLGDITFALQNERVVQLIGALTGIEGLEPDADLSRGGLSMMFRGDYLNPHIDNSHDSQRDRYRRLNILYYVTPDWNLDCGGNFELWDESRKFPKTIVAGNNKLIVMETNRSSWHSVNRVRVDRVRCCISNYYYSKSSPDGDDYYHVTSFDGRPNQGLRSYISRADNYTRGLISKITGKSRG
jgi:Rps23 Pro-64 3,4-dihydroxylase Tpa1-like proline 4-hydroxylase